ncbi:hypothetical protein BT67DRAFT_358921, partial [Trichocladium antarcticum]
MTTSRDLRPMLPGTSSSHAACVVDNQPRMFKKHKVLPHPRNEDKPRSGRRKSSLGVEGLSAQNGSSPSSSSYRPQQPRQVGRTPELPPTPPAHSRTPSASRPVDPSSPEHASSTSRSTDIAESRPPATPPNLQTPPTPNLTPDRGLPGPAAREPQPRPPLSDRIPSKFTTDSRTESFRTARENPYSSDDDDGKSTLRPALPSSRTSQSTVRQVSGGPRGGGPQSVGLGLGLESNSGDNVTPRTAREFSALGGEWSTGVGAIDVEEEWDANLWRNVTVRKRRPTASREASNKEVINDMAVKPTNATRALRSVSLQESSLPQPSRRVVSDRLPTQATVSIPESCSSTDFKRSSIMSTRSTASAVVEAILMETALRPRKTLRHVRKQSALRNTASDVSPASSVPTSVSVAVEDSRPQHVPTLKVGSTKRESHASTTTNNSISSRKARREIWKNGAVPVIVIPDRRSSVKSSKEPSLRSTSSRRSRSLSSAPNSLTSKSKDHVPIFERPFRRSRALSESDGSRPGDERTIDFPPVIPTRSSSLSAPTSRNVSRTGSLTADSLKAHNTFQAQQAHYALQRASRELHQLQSRTRPSTGHDSQRDRGAVHYPTLALLSAKAERDQFTVLKHAPRDERREPVNGRAARVDPEHDTPDPHEEYHEGFGTGRNGDPVFGKRLSVQNTPFSVASVDTTGTSHAEHEVSEAMAVNIYPHQSKSVLLVDHSTKPSTRSSLEKHKPSELETPTVRLTNASSAAPVTPPQQFSVDDVDSPLRNPRAPPKPPVINFIPATPSGLTPAIETEKHLGNYYEMTEEKPKRSLSLLRRTFSRGRTTEYGPPPARPVGRFKRAFSLSRNVRRDDDDRSRRPQLKRRSTADDTPDESRLHPFWRPTYVEDGSSSDDDDNYDDDDDDDDDDEEEDEPHQGRTYRYPPIDNRPRRPRRSLSARLKHTFAILPTARDDDDHYGHYPATRHDAPDRRTIRRTPSGNLRVMKFRRSMESLERTARPYTAPEEKPRSGGGGGGGDGGVGGNVGRYARLWRTLSSAGPRSRSRSGQHGPPPAYVSASADADEAGRATGGATTGAPGGGGFLPALGDRMNLTRRISERRREKRTQELRGMISGPRELRDGVGDVIRR